jgi:ATP-dependent exoDNAse (exonuclease V) beta subunit
MNKPPPDFEERTKAIRERAQNVIVDAGAGTGKTTLLVARLLHLIAPDDDALAFPLERLAAITFTRKAAGELKLRLRDKLLYEASRADLTAVRQQRLSSALDALDTASIGTVHSFADRLLRLRPIDARLSPAYDIAEDPGPLIDEMFQGLLADAAHGGGASGTEAEALETVRLFQAAGLLVHTEETEWAERLGLDAFVRDVIETRDRSVVVPDLSPPDLPATARCIDELGRLVGGLPEAGPGSQRLRRLHRQATRIVDPGDTAESLRRAIAWSRDLSKSTKALTKRDHFPDDPDGWDALNWLTKGFRGARDGKEERDGGPLGYAVVQPLFAYLANRLVRLHAEILLRYLAVKRAHGMVDHIDLLIQLRDLLQRNPPARAFYQDRFDHVLVDEFQDTDPLQAEIILYLCEEGAHATRIEDLTLRPGKLTIVGDPKQSIYRFRRADIGMYTAVCEKMRSGGACEAQLTVNFRSAATILDWLNEGFDAVLGRAEDGPRFDATAGTVRNVRLVPAHKAHPHAAVHVLPFGDAKLNAEQSRDLEGEALAHYVRYLVEESELRIADPDTRELRRPHYGDIAVIMIATQTVHHLTAELDRIGVPHVVRGGTLFMQDPLQQQFVLGLRALSDPRDGVATASLRRPPFFAVSLEDLVRARCSDTKSAALEAAEELIVGFRRDRHQRTPGETARHVLEHSGYGRYVAAGVNGAQRLARLYHLCSELDALARLENLDFDGVTRVARGWIEAPPRIEVPLPVDADAVQVITAHQAKGLEWPIVALWDGRASFRTYLPQVAFRVDAVSGRWAVKLDGLAYDPNDAEIHKRETELRAAERKRVAYVAMTRARDILIVPEAGPPDGKTIAGMLITSARDKPCKRVAAYQRSKRRDAWWRRESPVTVPPLAAIRENLSAAWSAAAERAFEDALRPAGITTVAHAVRVDVRDTVDAEPAPLAHRVGRYGPAFGATVHRALQLVLDQRESVEAASLRAAREHILEPSFDAVRGDVERALEALRRAGLLAHPRRLEYPVAASLNASTLVSGYIDLLIAAPDELCVIDFKTDAVPAGDVHANYPAYVTQVRAYAAVLDRAGIVGTKSTKTGLLFTADGGLRWV